MRQCLPTMKPEPNMERLGKSSECVLSLGKQSISLNPLVLVHDWSDLEALGNSEVPVGGYKITVLAASSEEKLGQCLTSDCHEMCGHIFMGSIGSKMLDSSSLSITCFFQVAVFS